MLSYLKSFKYCKSLSHSLFTTHFVDNPLIIFSQLLSNFSSFKTNQKNFTTNMHNSLITTQESSRTNLVNSICSLLSSNVGNVESLLNDYKEMLSSELVMNVLSNYKQLGRIRTLEFFSWAGLQMKFKFDDCVVEYMVDFLGRRKLFDDMKGLLMSVILYKGCVSCRAFAICIRFLGRQGRFGEALCLFQEMESKFKCRPDNFVYNNMLYVLCKKDHSGEMIDVALSIFREMESPDTYSYSNVLVGLCTYGRLETAVGVFHEMCKNGLMPTRSAVNVLISKLCLLSSKEGAINKVRVSDTRRPFTILVPYVGSKSGTIVHAVDVFSAVYGLGLLPGTFVIVQLLTEVCRLGKMDEAVNVLKVAEEKKLNCVEAGYSIVIQALCERRLVEEVSHLFGRMLSRKLKPKLAVYNAIICMLCKVGSLNDAKRVFEIMNEKRCLPDNITFTALIHAYTAAQRSEDAYRLLTEMLAFGCIPHFNTFTMVDKLLKEHGRMDLSMKLEGKMESQILLKHCKAGELETAYEKLRSMLGRGLCPPMYMRDALEKTFYKYGKGKVAHELLQMINTAHREEGEERTVCNSYD